MVTLPYLTSELAGTGGALRTSEEDFVVDEQLPYSPSGAGDHVFVRIEKRGLTSPAAAQLLARALGVRERDIGIAGMKDRRAVTRQWMSLPPPVTPEQVRAITLPDLRVLEAHRHAHKLRTGHVRANRFVLRVRGAPPDAAERARAILDALARPPGAPNWYGEQRFGKHGDNAARGMALVTGASGDGAGRRDRRLDRLMVSALQSQLFNDWLEARLADGLYHTVIAGDLLHKRGGGLFVCDDPATDAARLLAGELVVTGPMFGERMRQPPDGSPAAEREAQILARHGLDRAAFAGVRAIAEGTRRDATIEVDGATVVAVDGSTLEIAFTLPGGAYATVVMREIMKDPAERVDATPEGA
ncbi:MAG TPA: tRNA pseudouridine(13) synthase TruD [Kofleriaceae bacterium]|nr:tRNA pseudouridine(13) synthase TruD [Kofleriaceae bacterium]